MGSESTGDPTSVTGARWHVEPLAAHGLTFATGQSPETTLRRAVRGSSKNSEDGPVATSIHRMQARSAHLNDHAAGGRCIAKRHET
jgi:hypothetical protein